MALPPLVGHAEARAALGRAAAAGALPHSLLLHGPTGIGKERLGLWLAQLLLCEAPVADGTEPCGACRPCRLAVALQHPDIHWFFPLPRPDASSPEKLRTKLEELRAAELDARRSNPLHQPAFDRPPAHYLAAVLTMQQAAAKRPAMGSRKVFVVGDAERMVPQESSPEAANAFLKLLEEPPPDTTLVLTAESAGTLLPTIVSRVLPVRLRPLAAAEVAQFLTTGGAAAPPQAQATAAAARGSIGRALRMLPSADGPSALDRVRLQARGLLEAVLSASAVPRLAAAHGVAPAGSRGDFLELLDAFALWLRDLLAVASQSADPLLNPDAEAFLRRSLQSGGFHAPAVATALARVDPARRLAEGNLNPQLVLADLLRTVQADLAASA